MKNFSKFSKSYLLKPVVLLSVLTFSQAFAAVDTEIAELEKACGKETKIYITSPFLPPHHVDLEPGQQFNWKIKNISRRYDAKNIELSLPAALANEIEVTYSDVCESLPPGKTCTVTTKVIGNQPVATHTIEFFGCNTKKSAKGELAIVAGHNLLIGDGNESCFSINHTGNQELLLTNISDENITFSNNQVSFDGVYDISVGSVSHLVINQCKKENNNWVVPAKSNCTLPIAAGENAYNTTAENGKIIITYQFDDYTQTSEGCISVDNTRVSINNGQPIQVPTGSHSTSSRKEIQVKNVGPFAWRNPLITFAPEIEHLKVKVLTHTCKYGVGKILPGQHCTVLFESTSSDAIGTGILSAEGSNIHPNPTTEEVHVGDVTITLASEDEQTLQYQKILVSNNFADGPVHIKNVTWSESLNDQIKWCQSRDFSCSKQFRSDCDPNVPLLPQSSCSIWIKSLNTDSGLTVKDGVISVSVISGKHNKEWQAEFEARKENSLYVTGFFNRAGYSNIEAYSIAKWNGTEWARLGDGLQYGEGRALVVYQGDLYVGGRFASAGFVPNTKNIARWNGETWLQLGTEPYVAPNRPVNTFLVSSDQISPNKQPILMLGGDFTTVGGQQTPHLAAWNGSVWRPLNNRSSNGPNGFVYDLANYNHGLYVAGDYSRAGTPGRFTEISANNIAGFVNGEWQNLKGKSFIFNGTNRTIYSLYAAGDNNLYAAGAFNWVLGNRHFLPPFMPFRPAHHVAVWNGATWEPVGKNHRDINNTVFDITSFDQTLYIAGSFKKGNTLQYVAFLNGNDRWQTAGGQIDGNVYNLLSHHGRLYAGGRFGAGIFDNIAYWTGSGNWVEIEGGGVTSTFDKIPNRVNLAQVKSLLVTHSLHLDKHGNE